MAYNYGVLKARCEAYANSRVKRARELCKEAGLDPSLLGIHPHNAMCSYKAGKPWPNVNYSLVRKCIREMELQWQAHRVLDRLYRRVPGKFRFGTPGVNEYSPFE